MRAALNNFLLLLSLTLTLRAADCPLVFPVSDAGWYNAANFHDPENHNFITGHHAAGRTELRNFFVFDLPVLNGPVGGAELRIYTFTISTPQSTETYELRHVATPVETLVAGAGAELTNVFNDLGDGVLYAARVVTNSEVNSYITIPLNADALAALNAASGQRVALGGRISTLAAAPGVDEKLFAFSSGTTPYVELTLTFAGTNAPFLFQQRPPLLITNSSRPVTFSASACGAEPLRYRWFFNGVPLNQTNSTLTLSAPSSASSGTYFVVVTNVFGAVTSAPTELVVDGFAPVIFNLPSELTVLMGQPVGLSVWVSGNPYPALQWQVAGLDIPGATSSYYEVPAALTFQEFTLSLVATNLLGTVTNHVTLRPEPMLFTGPNDQQVSGGKTVYVAVDMSGQPPFTYQWRRDGTNLPGAITRVLTFTNFPAGASNGFAVVVTNPYGTRTSAVATVTSPAFDPPVALPPRSTLPGRYGRDSVLFVQASGALPMRFQWLFNGQPLAGETNASLMLLNFSTGREGGYSYVATNQFGVAVSPELLLSGSTEPASLYPLTTSREAFADEVVSLLGTPFGSPPPSLQWQRNGTNLPGATNLSLLFTNVTPADSGYYLLQASNRFNTTVVGISLGVQPRRALDRWTWRNSSPQANDLLCAAFGNGRFVAAGESGSIVTSTNGADWTVQFLGQHLHVRHAVFGNGLFAVLTDGLLDPPLLFTSTNGTDWRPQALTMPGQASLYFVNGEFVLTGFGFIEPLTLLRSTDARNWSRQILPTQYNYASVVGLSAGNGLQVLVNSDETLVSTDGWRWTTHAVPTYPRGLVFANGLFVVTTFFGEVWTSADGRAWFLRHSVPLAPGGPRQLTGVAGGQGQIIAVGQDGTIVRSPDGQTWTSANSTTTRSLQNVIFNGTEWLVTGNDGVLLTSPNGVTWTDRRAGRTRDLYGIIFTNQQFVAVGYEGTVLTSPDALAWTVRASGTTRDLHAITYANGLYVAGGRVGTVITSPNAVNWTTRATPTTNYIERLAWGSGRFVAAATHGTILTSTNGLAWTQHAHPAPPDTAFEGVAFGGGRFVMVGVNFNGSAHSIMLASSNGVDWVNTSVDVGKGLRGVAHDGQQFLAVGNDGVVIFSSNGLNWAAPQFVTPFRNWRHVRAALGHFITVGNNGAVADFATFGNVGWHPHTSVAAQNLHDVAYGAGKFVAVGNAGTILQSEFAVPHFSTPAYTNGVTRFRITGGLEEQYRVQSSLFLNFWSTVGTYTNDGNGVTFTNAGHPFQGFYRAVSP